MDRNLYKINLKRFTYFLLCSLFLSGTSFKSFSQSPGGVSDDNTLWLKADEGVSLNNQNLTEWEDQSGANITGNFETITPGPGGTTQYEPSFNPNGINFNPYIEFDQNAPNSVSSENAFQGSELFTHENLTFFQVINLKTTSGTGVWVKWQTANNTNDRFGNEVNNGGANSNRQRFDLRGVNLYSNSQITNTHRLIVNHTRPSQLITRILGAEDNTINSSNYLSNSGHARITFGNENPSGGDPYPTTIDIAELIIYKKDLSEEEINKVESYLAVKYGFTLEQNGNFANNYVSSNDEIIWNNQDNQGYTHRITGIGRDNNSSLNQKQSKSVHDGAIITLFAETINTIPVTNAENNTQINNNSFILIGDNNQSLNFNQCTPDGKAEMMSRVWKAQATGSLHTATIGINASDFPNASQLIVSEDSDFTQNVSYIPLETLGDLKIAEYNTANGVYFTFSNDPIELNAELEHLICVGDKGKITLNPTGGSAPYSYQWQPGNSSSNVLDNITEGTYTVNVRHGNSCIYTESFEITNEMQEMQLNTRVENAFCGNPNGKVSIEIEGGTSPFVYELGNQSQDDKRFTNVSPGTHTIKVTDDKGCVIMDNVQVPNLDYDLRIEFESNDAYCDLDGLGGEIIATVINNGYPPFQYYWQNFTGYNNDSLLNIPAGSYQVRVVDANGCEGFGNHSIGEYPCCDLFLPNAFTPNNDGLNDIFKPVASETMITYQIEIFNRFGQLVYTSVNPSEGWDGTFMGKPAEQGVYYYYGKYSCMASNKVVSFEGDLTLIR